MDTPFIDISKANKLNPKKGRILLAEPLMNDDHFSRSVIYLCEHNEDGSYGFILNNLLNLKLNEIITDENLPKLDVFYGGPVHATSLFYIHQMGDTIENSIHLENNIYTGGDFNQIIEFLNLGVLDEKKIKFFLGYSGWSKNQLKDEIKAHSWIVSEIESEKVFIKNDDLWKNILEKKGGKYKALANFPLNPSDN
jgi:putative transcriptional regulator